MSQEIPVLLISPFPPPWGGVSSITERMMRRGLPGPYEFLLVDKSIWPRRLFQTTTLGLGEIKRNLRILWEVYRGLSFGKVRLVHHNFTPTRVSLPRDYLITLISNLFAVPIITQCHTDLPKFDLGGWLGVRRWLFVSTLKRSARILVLTQDSVSYVLRIIPGARVEYLPNFVECSRNTPARQSPSIGSPMRVVFVGGLAKQKGVWDLLESAARVEGIAFRLVGVPTNDIQQQLQGFLSEHNLENRVEILGALPNNEVQKAMLEADVFCLPSYKEAFPVSLLEAMASGLPIVATRVGGVPEIFIPDQGGYLIAPGDIDALTIALETLRDHPELRQRMGENNRQRVLDNFEYRLVCSRLAGIYEAVLRSPCG